MNLAHPPTPVTTTCGMTRVHVVWTTEGDQIETRLRERCVMPAAYCEHCRAASCALHHLVDCPRLDVRAATGWEVMA